MKKSNLLMVFLLTAVCLFSFTQGKVKAEVVVYDADGQMLGLLIDYDLNYIYGLKVFDPSLSKFIMLNPLNGHIKTVGLYFSSFDCTGTPYIRMSEANFININGNNYYTGSIVETTVFSAHSTFIYDECRSGNYNNSYVPAEDVTDIVDLPSPVAVPLNFDIKPTQPGKWKK